MKPKQLKKFLLSEIKLVSENVNEYCFSKGKDFTRKRKLSFETVIKTLIGMESKSLSNELITAFDTEPEMPSTSAFVQQRYKIKPEAFKAVFDGFTSRLINNTSTELRIFTIDGSDIQIATNSDDATSYFPGTNGQNPYNLLHLNALYDLNNHIYTDAIIQGGMDKNEHIALQEMVDNSDIFKALVIADRGYESFNSMAHIQEKSRLKELSSRKQCQSIRPSLEKIKVYARGWLNYYGIASMKNNIDDINGWLYHRIRMCIWKQWKKPRTKYKNLVKLGIPEHYAATIANSRRKYWYISNNKAVIWALNKERLINSGYYDLATAYQSVHVNY